MGRRLTPKKWQRLKPRCLRVTHDISLSFSFLQETLNPPPENENKEQLRRRHNKRYVAIDRSEASSSRRKQRQRMYWANEMTTDSRR